MITIGLTRSSLIINQVVFGLLIGPYSNPPTRRVMSRILLAIWGNKIYWDRQLKLIKQLESTMGRV
jgi:hypothetical protein